MKAPYVFSRALAGSKNIRPPGITSLFNMRANLAKELSATALALGRKHHERYELSQSSPVSFVSLRALCGERFCREALIL
jgi:hypothetical protein